MLVSLAGSRHTAVCCQVYCKWCNARMMAQRSSTVPSLAHMVAYQRGLRKVSVPVASSRGDERVQIVGVLEMQVAEQPALGERLARRQRIDGK